MDPAEIAQLRMDIPALRTSCYLNTGTLGLSPRSTSELFFRLCREWQDAGSGNPRVYEAAAAAAAKAKERIAAFVGATGSELALTGNTTEGVNIVANGLGLEPGDEVIISDQEHPAGLLIWLHLRQTTGIRIRIARLSPDDRSRNVEEVEALITPRTRLVALSHVSCQTGLRLPAREITETAHARGVPVLLDGAQSVGQFEVDLGEIGCDYYTLNGHKWLLGPPGTGALYVSSSALRRLVPDRVGGGSAERWDYAEDGDLVLHDHGGRFEFGTRLFPLYPAWAASLNLLERIGLRAVSERSLELAQRLRRGLEDIPGVEVLGPTRDPLLMTALVSCRLRGLTGRKVYETLLDRFNIVARPVDELDAVRFSTAFYNTEEEVDLALRALATLARDAAA